MAAYLAPSWAVWKVDEKVSLWAASKAQKRAELKAVLLAVTKVERSVHPTVVVLVHQWVCLMAGR